MLNRETTEIVDIVAADDEATEIVDVVPDYSFFF